MLKEQHQVKLSWLPSKGRTYPDNIEIYVSPMTIRGRKLLEGANPAEYYRILLEGISIRGPYDKKNLLFHDVQFLDIARRIFTYSTDDSISISSYMCPHCNKTNVATTFKASEMEYEDYAEDIFFSEKNIYDEETGEIVKKELTPGKNYTFSDGMEVTVLPLTIGEYIDMMTTYITNKDLDDIYQTFVETFMAQFIYLIKEIPGRMFKDDKMRRDFLESYIFNLYSDEDSTLLDKIDEDSNTIPKPIITVCPDCGKEVEVHVTPSLRFQRPLQSV